MAPLLHKPTPTRVRLEPFDDRALVRADANAKRVRDVHEEEMRAQKNAATYCENVAKSSTSFAQFKAAPNLTCLTPAQVPRGGVAMYYASEPMEADFIDTNLHCGVSLYRVTGGMQEFDHADALQAGLEYHIETSTNCSAPPSLSCMGAGSLQDKPGSVWECCLDRSGAFVGLYHTAIRAPLHPAMQAYVIAVHAGPGQAGEDLYNVAEEMASRKCSWQEFLNSQEYRCAEHLGKRNRNRLAYRFAAALGLSVASMGDFCEGAPVCEADADVRGVEPGLLSPDQFEHISRLPVGGQIDALLEYSLELTTELGHWLSIDPSGDNPENPHVDHRSGDSEATTTQNKIATPFSETVYNSISVSGSTVCVYSGVKSLASIGAGHGVALLLNPAEGIAVQHGRDADPLAECPFGMAVSAGPLQVVPVTTGRLVRTKEVTWCQNALHMASYDGCLQCLAWHGKDNGEPNDKALHGDRSVYRARDTLFHRQVQAISDGEVGTTTTTGQTRLDPVFVVLHPTPVRRFLGGRFPDPEEA